MKYNVTPNVILATIFVTPKRLRPLVVSKEKDSYMRVENVVNPPTKPTPNTATNEVGSILSAPKASMTPSMVAPNMFITKVPNG